MHLQLAIVVVFALSVGSVSVAEAEVSNVQPRTDVVLELQPEYSSYVVGEPVRLKCELKNNGDAPFTYAENFAVASGTLRLFVAGEDQFYSEYRGPYWGPGEQVGTGGSVGPGQSITQELTLFVFAEGSRTMSFYVFDRPGKYTIRGRFDLPDGSITSLPVTIEVVPPTGAIKDFWEQYLRNYWGAGHLLQTGFADNMLGWEEKNAKFHYWSDRLQGTRVGLALDKAIKNDEEAYAKNAKALKEEKAKATALELERKQKRPVAKPATPKQKEGVAPQVLEVQPSAPAYELGEPVHVKCVLWNNWGGPFVYRGFGISDSSLELFIAFEDGPPFKFNSPGWGCGGCGIYKNQTLSAGEYLVSDALTLFYVHDTRSKVRYPFAQPGRYKITATLSWGKSRIESEAAIITVVEPQGAANEFWDYLQKDTATGYLIQTGHIGKRWRTRKEAEVWATKLKGTRQGEALRRAIESNDEQEAQIKKIHEHQQNRPKEQPLRR